MSKFFTDSDCELMYDKCEELDISVIGMPYTLNGEESVYDMGKTFDASEFYNKLKNGYDPATQALNPQNYIDYFEPILKSGEDIIYVAFSQNMSGTFQHFDSAVKELKEKYPERSIKYVNTLSITMGAGIIVYYAALMHKNGATDDEIIEYVEKNRQNFAIYFMVDDLNFLKRGGRVSSSAALFGTMLGIKPILKVDSEGRIVSVDKVKGKKKALLYFLDLIKNNGLNVADYPIVLMHTGDDQDIEFLKSKLIEYLGEGVDIWVQTIGPVIGCHCGPGTIGIIFRCTKR